MDYLALKGVHIALAITSITGFILRWYWMMRASPLAQSAPTKVLPHIIDSLFLLSGISLAWLLSLNPLDTSWLAAKLAGLVLYIALASVAFKPARTRRWRITCFIAALFVYAWIISVARLKTPLGFLDLVL